MSIERARELQRLAAELHDRLAALPIEDLEIVSSGRTTPTYLVHGFVADEATRREIAKLLEASGLAIRNQIMLDASRDSGPAPSSFDGAADASPARRTVRGLLNRAAAARGKNEYTAAIALCREAELLAQAEPAVHALVLFALGYYLLEGQGFHAEPQTLVRPLIERARDLLGPPDNDPILHARITETLRVVAP